MVAKSAPINLVQAESLLPTDPNPKRFDRLRAEEIELNRANVGHKITASAPSTRTEAGYIKSIGSLNVVDRNPKRFDRVRAKVIKPQ